ncbi:MAG: hypothetical protein ACYCZZ_02030 [Minisyncoccota bacterium]
MEYSLLTNAAIQVGVLITAPLIGLSLLRLYRGSRPQRQISATQDIALGFLGAIIIGIPTDYIIFSLVVGCPNLVLPPICSDFANSIGNLSLVSAVLFYLIAPLIGIFGGIYLSHHHTDSSFTLQLTPEEMADPTLDQRKMLHIAYWLLGIVGVGSFWIQFFAHPHEITIDDWEHWGRMILDLAIVTLLFYSSFGRRPKS